MDVNQRQYSLILEQGHIPKKRLDQAFSHPNRRVYNDFVDFLLHSLMLRADIALKIRAQALQPIPETVDSTEKKPLTPFEFEQIFQKAQLSAPLFSPHARVQFKLVEKLGEGGMGVVHRIEDKKLGRTAALKVLGAGSADERAVTRFIREAKITASLVHPNIPPIYELGMNSSGEHYMLMKVIEGQSLKEAINEVHSEGKADPKEVRRLLEALVKVCEAMAYAHSKEVIHRDLKPENIMIGEFGEVMVLDWGLAKDLSVDQDEDIALNDQRSVRLREAAQREGLTGAGDLLGTVGYMAPEQVDGQASKQSDVFALGAILTEILTGKSAISGEGLIAKLSATIQGRIRGPRDLLKSALKELNALALKATRVSPKDRTESIEGFVADLRSYLAGEELRVYRYGLLVRSQRWISRHPTLMSSAVLLLLLVLVGLYFQSILEDAEIKEKLSQRAEAVATEMRDRLERSLQLFEEADTGAVSGLDKQSLREQVNEALKLGGRSESQLLRAATIYKKAKLFDEAKTILAEVEREFQPAYEALYLEHIIETGDKKNQFLLTDAFNRLVEKAKKRGDENEFTLMADAFKAFGLKNWREIIAFCDKMETYTASRYELFMVRALAKSELKDPVGAIADYDLAISLYPSNPIAFENRAVQKIAIRDVEGAKDDYRSALTFDGNRIPSRIGLAEIALAEGNLKEALFIYESACKKSPSNWSVYFHRGCLRVQMGKLDSALSDFNRSIALDSTVANVYVNRGILLAGMKKYSEAVLDFKAAIVLDRASELGHIGIGKVYIQLNQLQTALGHLEFACKNGPRNPTGFKLRAVTKQLLKNYLGAVEDYSKAIELGDRESSIFLSRGNVLVELDRHKEAALDYEQYLKLDKTNPESEKIREFIKLHLGRRSRY